MKSIIYAGKKFNGNNLYIDNGCWRRKNNTCDITDECLIELAGNIMYLTNELCFNNTNFSMTPQFITDQDSEIYNDMTCLCGYSKCGKLYIAEHTPTKTPFAVGSVCINKFKPVDYDIINRTDFCLVCCQALWYKTSTKHKKNGKKDYPYCNDCNKLLFNKKIFKLYKNNIKNII
jgi:hypothetical protein